MWNIVCADYKSSCSRRLAACELDCKKMTFWELIPKKIIYLRSKKITLNVENI
mgnify:CR=1 FL=1